MVTYGDGVSDVNIKSVLDFFEQKKVIGVITGVHPKSKWGLIVSGKDGIVKRFQEKPRFNQYVNGGFMVFTKKIFDYLTPGDMIHDAFPRLSRDRQLAVFIHEGFWAAMDTYQDMEDLNKMWSFGMVPEPQN